MTHSEAIRQIESWLLVPVDYENILPALYTLRGSSDFDKYIVKVADTEFRKPNEIADDVERYAQERPTAEAREAAINKKLEAISGVKDRKISEAFAEDDADVLDALENRINRKYDAIAQKQDQLNDAFQKYVNGYKPKRESSALVPTCSHCDHPLESRVVETGISTAWIILAFVLCWPIGLFLLVTMHKRTVRQQYCPRCGAIHHENSIITH